MATSGMFKSIIVTNTLPVEFTTTLDALLDGLTSKGWILQSITYLSGDRLLLLFKQNAGATS